MLFSSTKEKVQRKVAGWKAKALSQAGRTVLIKSVAMALPSYVMSVFLLPKGLCAAMDAMLKNFWWGFTDGKTRNFHPKAWTSICQPKEKGGLGIRRMFDVNQAMVAKLGWQVLSNADCLWLQVLRAKYFGNQRFMTARSPPDSPWIWKGIMQSRGLLAQGACWFVNKW